MNANTILIAAGGTGGHIFPALAVAQKMQEKGYIVHWLGSPSGLEAKMDMDYPLHLVSIKGIRKKGLRGWLALPFKLSLALIQTLRVLRKVKPKAVFCFGGYVSFPAGVCAWLCRIPVFIQEQNSKAGLTNRLLSHLALKIFTAYPGAMAQYPQKQVYTGNPVRQFFEKSAIVGNRKNIDDVNILVIGGSQGAAILNHVVPHALALLDNMHLKILHQCGEKHLQTTENEYQQAGVSARIERFIVDMPAKLHEADIVICRAGALTITELMLMGKASILVPLPHAADNHQYFNARFMTDHKAALLCDQDNMTPSVLAQRLTSLIDSREYRDEMASNARQLAKPNACEDIVRTCLPYLR